MRRRLFWRHPVTRGDMPVVTSGRCLEITVTGSCGPTGVPGVGEPLAILNRVPPPVPVGIRPSGPTIFTPSRHVNGWAALLTGSTINPTIAGIGRGRSDGHSAAVVIGAGIAVGDVGTVVAGVDDAEESGLVVLAQPTMKTALSSRLAVIPKIPVCRIIQGKPVVPAGVRLLHAVSASVRKSSGG